MSLRIMDDNQDELDYTVGDILDPDQVRLCDIEVYPKNPNIPIDEYKVSEVFVDRRAGTYNIITYEELHDESLKIVMITVYNRNEVIKVVSQESFF